MQLIDVDLERLKEENNIVDIISRHVELSPKGNEMIGLCPFHEEKTPSFKVNESKQMFKCFGCGVGGDSIQFLRELGYSMPEAIQELSNRSIEFHISPPVKRVKKESIPKWTQLTPKSRPIEITHYEHGKPSAIYEYHNEHGDLLGLYCRFEFEKGKKEVLPYIFATNGNWETWRWQGFDKPRPLYNLHEVKNAATDKTILIVEGEKTANAAKLLFPQMVVSTWQGGSNAIEFTNWDTLSGKNVILWPDNDKVGEKAMNAIAQILSPISQRVWIIKNPSDVPKGWDLADANDWTPDRASKHVIENSVNVPKGIVDAVQSPATKPRKSSNPMKEYQLWIKKLGLKRNVLTREYEDKFGVVQEEEHFNSLYQEARIKFEKISRKDFDTIVRSLQTPDYNPLLDYFNSIKWDGKDRLTDLCNSVTSTTGTPDWRKTMITKWIAGSVNTVYNGTPNILNLVFAGMKNTGKTQFFLRLLPKEINTYFAASQLDRDKDDEILMTKKMFIFDDEYGGKSKNDSKKLKRLSSAPNFTLRAAYAAKDRTLKRLATLCGTCNELEILNDPTGNRRIIVIEATGKFDFALFNSVDKTQLFGQLVHMVKNGFDCNLTDSEIEQLNAYTSREFSEVVLEDELIRQYFMKASHGGGQWMTTSMIKVYLEEQTGQRLNIRRLGLTLRESGFERVSKTGLGYGYMVIQTNGVAIETSRSLFDEKIANPFELP